jgi:hypothetical protein
MQNLRKEISNRWHVNLTKENLPTEGDLEELFRLYDDIVFFNQIKERSLQKNITITFGEQKDFESLENIKRFCGIIYYENIINLQISPWIIDRFLENKKNKDQEDILLYFLSIFEHQLLHLCTLLWVPEKELNDFQLTTVNVHGNVFKCILKNFFSKKITNDITINLSKKDSYIQPFSDKEPGRYKYWENSCNIDALTSIFYTSKSTAFRDAIFLTNVDLIDYAKFNETSKLKNSNLLFKSPCSFDSGIKSEEQFRNIVKEIQIAMFSDYTIMIEKGENIKCSNLRELLSQCYTDMKTEYSEWDVYNVAELYVLFVQAFPKLYNLNYPVYTNYPLEIRERISNEQISIFTFWEFIYDDLETQDRPLIDWNEFNSDILVFRNGGNPAILNFGSTDSEIIKIPEYKKIIVDEYKYTKTLPKGWKRAYSKEEDEYFYFNAYTGEQRSKLPKGTIKNKIKTGKTKEKTIETKTKIEINKTRAFGEYIINNRYELIGAIILQGTKPGEEGGVHYISYIKTINYQNDNTWIKYNDIGNIWDKIDGFPEKILIEKINNKPEMYFYMKIKDYK